MGTPRECKIYEFSRKFLEPKLSKQLNQYVTTGFEREIGWETKKVPKEIANIVYNNGLRINDNYPPQKDEIALIGRELEKYAVLAVATGVVDDSDRPLVAYRYFWLEKSSRNYHIDGVGTLLRWWTEQDYPCFELKPSAEYQNYKKSHQGSLSYKKDLLHFYKSEIQYLFRKIPPTSHNYSIYFEDYEQTLNDPGVLHSLALLLNKEYKSPINWAFNIDKLESPEQFTLIYTQGYSQSQLIINNLNQLSETVGSFSHEISTDIQLKRCLIEIARNKNIESNFLKLANYLKEADSDYWKWEGILDKTVLSNHDITTARYRALLAILKPLPEIYNWLNWLGKIRNKGFMKAGIDLQDQLLKFLKSQEILDQDQINNKIDHKIDELLLWNLSTGKEQHNHTIKDREWLLIQSNSFWTEYFRENIPHYHRVLFNQINNAAYNYHLDKFSQQILLDWQTYEKDQSLPTEKKYYYGFIAELFSQVKSYSLAALFYQLSWGEVPIDIYNKAEISIINLKKSSQSSGLIALSISNIKEDLKILLTNLKTGISKPTVSKQLQIANSKQLKTQNDYYPILSDSDLELQ